MLNVGAQCRVDVAHKRDLLVKVDCVRGGVLVSVRDDFAHVWLRYLRFWAGLKSGYCIEITPNTYSLLPHNP